MSFLAKLELDGETYNVLDFRMGFSQSVDSSGKPSSDPQGGNFSLVVESTNSTNFFKWMIANADTKSGTIIFYRRDAISKMRELKFEKAYCIGYNEIFHAENTLPMRVELSISASKLSMNGVNYERNWTSLM